MKALWHGCSYNVQFLFVSIPLWAYKKFQSEAATSSTCYILHLAEAPRQVSQQSSISSNWAIRTTSWVLTQCCWDLVRWNNFCNCESCVKLRIPVPSHSASVSLNRSNSLSLLADTSSCKIRESSAIEPVTGRAWALSGCVVQRREMSTIERRPCRPYSQLVYRQSALKASENRPGASERTFTLWWSETSCTVCPLAQNRCSEVLVRFDSYLFEQMYFSFFFCVIKVCIKEAVDI